MSILMRHGTKKRGEDALKEHIPLNHVRNIAKRYKDYTMYCSPLNRTIETANVLTLFTDDREYVVLNALREDIEESPADYFNRLLEIRDFMMNNKGIYITHSCIIFDLTGKLVDEWSYVKYSPTTINKRVWHLLQVEDDEKRMLRRWIYILTLYPSSRNKIYTECQRMYPKLDIANLIDDLTKLYLK